VKKVCCFLFSRNFSAVVPRSPVFFISCSIWVSLVPTALAMARMASFSATPISMPLKSG